MIFKVLQQRITGSSHWPCIKFFLTVIAVYVVLFELILTPVAAFPKPSLIFESLAYLIEKFDVLNSLGLLWGLIFGGMIFTFLLTYLIRVPLISFFVKYPDFFLPFRIFLFFTPLGLILFWNIYFTETWLTDFALIVLIGLAVTFAELANALKSKDSVYELAAKGLGKSEKEIYSKVTWMRILPALREKISPIQIKMWSYVLISQFISGYSLGGLFRELFNYRDVAGIYALAILIWLAVHLNEVFWYFTSRKVIFWES